MRRCQHQALLWRTWKNLHLLSSNWGLGQAWNHLRTACVSSGSIRAGAAGVLVRTCQG